jgi:ElaB/YqjD/DUF883 family membrane-anchored ribosome-binding protein
VEEDKTYLRCQKADEEVKKIWAEIDQVFKLMPDRKTAEKKVLEEIAPRMDAAMKESKEACDQYFQEIKKLRDEVSGLVKEGLDFIDGQKNPQ